MKPEDIKVGSLWAWCLSDQIKGRVVAASDRYVSMVFTEHANAICIGLTWTGQTKEFLGYYRPVYTIEGFEV